MSINIDILTQQGDGYSFEIEKSKLVKELKLQIKNKLCMEVDEQTLIYADQILQNDTKLCEYINENRCQVKLIFNLKKDVFNCSVENQFGEKCLIEVNSTTTLANIKSKVQCHFNLFPEEQILIVADKVLDGEDLVSRFGIVEGSMIILIPRLIGRMQIIARTMDGIIVPIEIVYNDAIIDVKKKIQEKIGLSPDKQKLKYDDVLLEDAKTLDEYQIVNESVIVILTKRGITITAQTEDRKKFTFDMTMNDRIIYLKKKIRDKTGLSTDKQRLTYNGIPLEDDTKMISDCHITEDGIINVVEGIRDRIRVLVKTLDGKEVSFEVNKSDKIIEMKKKIQEKIGLLTEEQKLSYEDNLLEDDKTVDECHISDDGSTIVVTKLRRARSQTGVQPMVENAPSFEVPNASEDDTQHAVIDIRDGILLNAKTSDGTLFQIQVIKNDKIIDIKKKIQEKIGLSPDDQKLVYQGGILEDDKIVDEYGIVETSVIDVVERLRVGIKISAKTVDGKTIAFEVTKNDRIIDIKKKIHEKIGLSPGEQKLVCQGVLFEDDKTVDEYRINEKSLINVVAGLRNGLQIFAKTMDGKIVMLEVTRNDKIIDIKKKIQEKIGLSSDEQKLVYLGVILEDDKTVDVYQITEKSVINVVIRSRDGLILLIQTMGGKMYAFEVTKNDTIIDIKKKIQHKIGLSPDVYNLIFKGRILEDDYQTVNESQIIEDSIINVVSTL